MALRLPVSLLVLALLAAPVRAEEPDPFVPASLPVRIELTTGGVMAGMLGGLVGCLAARCGLEGAQSIMGLGTVVGGVGGWFASGRVSTGFAHATSSGLLWGFGVTSLLLAADQRALRDVPAPELFGYLAVQAVWLGGGVFAALAFDPEPRAVALANSTALWASVLGLVGAMAHGDRAKLPAILLASNVLGLAGGAIWSRFYRPAWSKTWWLDLGALLGGGFVSSLVRGKDQGPVDAAGVVALTLGMAGGVWAADALVADAAEGAGGEVQAALVPLADGTPTMGLAGRF